MIGLVLLKFIGDDGDDDDFFFSNFLNHLIGHHLDIEQHSWKKKDFRNPTSESNLALKDPISGKSWKDGL